MEEDIKYLKSQEAYEMYFRGNPRLEKIVNGFIDKIKGLEEENSMLKKVNNITENITVEEVENAIKEASKEYIPTALIKEKIEEIKKYRDIAKELIEERVVIADSDSLNYGRAEAHDKDIQVLEELLKKGE